MINQSFSYRGCQVRQPEQIQQVMTYFLSAVRPARILEIGTFTGGLTLILRDILDMLGDTDVPIRTYDINRAAEAHLSRHPNIFKIEYIAKNLWPDFKELSPEGIEELREFIQRDGTTIVFCDGGNKPREFRTIAPLLKEGDYILGHDYCVNDTHFFNTMKDKIWNWCELTGSDTNPVIEENGLTLIWPYLFERGAWICAQKDSILGGSK